LRYTTPSGRLVFGGGGIYPDVIVGLDTNFDVATVSKVYSSAIHRRFVFQYAEKHRESLRKYKTPEQFATSFRFSEKDHKDFLAAMAGAGIKWPENRFEATLEYMFSDLRALLARQLFGVNAYFMVNHQSDQVIKSALRHLESYHKIIPGN
jgi:carboxyl-terminal processing protease